MVVVTKKLPPHPCINRPDVGTRGMIVLSDGFGNDYTPPENHVAVRFKSIDLGYPEWDEYHRFAVQYLPITALKSCPKK